MHSGTIDNKSCSINNSLSFLDNLDDRIIIENLVLRDKDKRSFCITPEETKEFLDRTKRKLCFDVNHCIESSIFLGENYMNFIKKFLKLNPTHFHIGGQKLNLIREDHISFKESYIPIKDILKLYPKNAEITLEVETDIKKTEYDLDFIREVVD